MSLQAEGEAVSHPGEEIASAYGLAMTFSLEIASAYGFAMTFSLEIASALRPRNDIFIGDCFGLRLRNDIFIIEGMLSRWSATRYTAVTDRH